MYSDEIEALYDLVAAQFNDNTTGEITPARARVVFGKLLEYVANLNTNQVKGALFRVPFIVYENGVLTVPTALIPVRSRILGMEVVAVNGTDAGTAGAGVQADPITFKLLAYNLGTIDALIDEQATTTTTIKAHWVRTSGSDEEKIVTFPILPLEDVNVYKGEVYQYTFTNPAVTRLLEIRNDITVFSHPVPTGLDSDIYYKSFAPLNAAAGYDDTALKGRVTATEAVANAQKQRLDTLVANAPAALDTLKEISDQLRADEQGAAAILSTQQQHTQQIQQLGQTDSSLQSQITANLNNAVYSVGTGGSGSLLKKNASNVSSNYQSAVLAGESSTASGGYALVGSGYINQALGNWSSIIGGRNNTLGANSQETYGGIFGSSYCAAYAPYCGIYNSSNCTIAATCSYTTLIGCTGLNITAGSNQTYVNNVLVGTTSGGTPSTLLVLDTTDGLRVSPGIPVRAKFQISDEVLDVNATAISYQLDTNTRTTRVYGSSDRTRAQINALLAALTAQQISEGAKLYVKTTPAAAAIASTINVLLTDL